MFKSLSRCFVLVLLALSAVSLFGQVSPVHPPQRYDGRCSVSYMNHTQAMAYVEFGCSGNFIGPVEAELSIEYASTSGGISNVSRAPAGHVSNSYPTGSAPSWDYLATAAPQDPNYLTRAVITVRWETDEFRCNWYTCGLVWDSETVASPWE